YLDPRRLSFWFDDSDTPLSVSQNEVMLDLQTLARLHGFTLPKTDEKGGPRSQPQHLSLAKARFEVQGTPAGFDAWRAWVNTGARELPNEPQLQPVIDVFREMCAGKAYTADNVAEALRPGTTLDRHNHWFPGKWMEELALQAIQDNAQEF